MPTRFLNIPLTDASFSSGTKRDFSLRRLRSLLRRAGEMTNSPVSLATRQGILQALDFGAQVVGALGDGNIKQKKHAPANQVRRKHAAQIFHCASTSRRRISTSDFIFSRT